MALTAGILCGCFKSRTVTIGCDNTAEEYVLGEMLKLLIEDKTDLNVKLVKGISGGTATLHPSILDGEIDMYPEYTGTAWQYVLKRKDIPPQEELIVQLEEEYQEKFGLKWVGLYGFNNAYGLAVREEMAGSLGLETYSDLARHSQDLIFGSEPDFYEREDGYQALCKAYGFQFQESVDMVYTLKYDALSSDEVQVINVFTTDGRLGHEKVKVLRDDKEFFQKYLCGTVIRSDTLEKYPQLESVLMLMDDLITDEEMTALNYQVGVENQEDVKAARQFLKAKGLIGE